MLLVAAGSLLGLGVGPPLLRAVTIAAAALPARRAAAIDPAEALREE